MKEIKLSLINPSTVSSDVVGPRRTACGLKSFIYLRFEDCPFGDLAFDPRSELEPEVCGELGVDCVEPRSDRLV